MKKTRLFMLVATLGLATLGLLGAQIAIPVNGQDLPILVDVSAAAIGPGLTSQIVISAVDNEKYLPSVAYNSKHNEYLVVWHTTWGGGSLCCRDIRGQRVSAQGQLLGSEFLVYENMTKDSAQPSVAYDPVYDRYLVTFIFDASGNGTDLDLWGRFIPWNGTSASLAAFPIISWSSSQRSPKVAYAGTQQVFFVVWSNQAAAGYSIPTYVSGKLITIDGNFFNVGADLTLSGPEHYINPDVSYNQARNEYLVVWQKVMGGPNNDIWGVRITASAVTLGGGPFIIAGWPDNEEEPAVAACNKADQYLVTWQSDVGSGGTTYDIYGYFVTGAGALDSPPILIVHSSGADIKADVACNGAGNKYLVVYQQLYTSVHYGIWGIPINTNHSMEGGFAIVPSGGTSDRTNPVVVGGRANYLVAWEHQRDGTSYQDIHGRLIGNLIYLPLIRR